MNPQTSGLDHNDRSAQIVLAETTQIFAHCFNQRTNRAPMKSSNENQAVMGSRRMGEEACQPKIAREKYRTGGRGSRQYEVI